MTAICVSIDHLCTEFVVYLLIVLEPGSPALRHQPALTPGPTGLVTWSTHPLPSLLGLLNRVHGGGVPLVFTSDFRAGEAGYRMRTWWSWHHTRVPSSNVARRVGT